MPRIADPLVFVVDDEKAIATTIAIILNASGFNCLEFSRSHEALAAASSKCPDVLIADLLMPGMNGFDLGSRLKTLCPAVKVFILTGLGMTTELSEQLQKAGSDYEVLHKPISPRELIARLRSLEIV